MDFVAIDFETANSSRSSVCSIGIVEYRNGQLENEFYSLVKPKDNFFDAYNTYIHGITEEDVEDKPEFDVIWTDVKGFIEEKLILAHNASFDISVLRHVLDEYDIDYPSCSYNCTRNIAKKAWPGLYSYQLSVVADHLDIYFKHHHALEDAHAAAKVYLNAFRNIEAESHEDLVNKLKLVEGSLFTNGYKPARVNKKTGGKGFDIDSLVAASTEFDESHPFYGSMFVFTGTLQSMQRKQAMQSVIDIGGLCGNGVTKQTNYIVIGDQDFSRFADGKKSSKLKKAEELISKGQKLEIISEGDFISLL
ncbi:exonuclease domain-containing protein [Metabacillus halosaccharovorans]|uniref:exonuclease domain-containing protein n=1 Tax=Metabacillus halosaccharovorans TaxID=930124 RepID=UPI00403DA224